MHSLSDDCSTLIGDSASLYRPGFHPGAQSKRLERGTSRRGVNSEDFYGLNNIRDIASSPPKMPTIALPENLLRQTVPSLFCITLTLLTLPAQATPSNRAISEIAKSITVHIASKSHGSGVIIQHKGNTYTLLSAAHVFKKQEQYTVLTSDGKSYPIIPSSIKPFPKVDLAIAQFNSNQNYLTARLGNSAQISRKTAFYLSGYTATPHSTVPTYHFKNGQIEANAPHPIEQGYALAYYPQTLPGMSGGPVLDPQGSLIGIQGLSLRPRATARAINPLGDLSDRLYLAIPINTFITLNSNIKTKPLNPAKDNSLTADDLFIRGSLHYAEGKSNEALTDFNATIRFASDYAPAYYSRAHLRAETGDIKGALADYTQALQLNPNYILAYYYRGGIYAEQGQLENAITDYNQALLLNPNLAVAHNNRGTVRYRLGDPKSAIADYDLALQKNPNLRDAYNNRGLARYSLGDFKGALSDCNQAIRLDLNYAMAYQSRSMVYQALGNPLLAQSDLQKAAQLRLSQPK